MLFESLDILTGFDRGQTHTVESILKSIPLPLSTGPFQLGAPLYIPPLRASRGTAALFPLLLKHLAGYVLQRRRCLLPAMQGGEIEVLSVQDKKKKKKVEWEACVGERAGCSVPFLAAAGRCRRWDQEVSVLLVGIQTGSGSREPDRASTSPFFLRVEQIYAQSRCCNNCSPAFVR